MPTLQIAKSMTRFCSLVNQWNSKQADWEAQTNPTSSYLRSVRKSTSKGVFLLLGLHLRFQVIFSKFGLNKYLYEFLLKTCERHGCRDGNIDLLAWSILHPVNYWMDCHWILSWQLLSPEDEAHWLWWSSDPSSCTTGRLTYWSW